MRNRSLLVAALAAFATAGAHGVTSTYTMPHKEPDNRGRRAEKDAEKMAKAEKKRKRRAEKRLAHNAEFRRAERT